MADTITQKLQISHFTYEECAWYVDRGFYDCLHKVHDNIITKAIPVSGGHTLISLDGEGSTLNITCDKAYEHEAVSYVHEWFDLKRDLSAFEKVAMTEPDFVPVYRAYSGLRLIRIPDLFEALSWSIIGQQINLAFAYTLKSRLVQTYGTEAADGHYLFPRPEVVAGLDPAVLQPLQFSRRKAEYLTGIASALCEGKLSKTDLTSLPDTAAMQNLLCSFRGIGPWSANYVLLRCLGRTDAIPHGDAGMINAYKKIFRPADKPTGDDICQYLNKFAGWQAYVVLYWWRHLSES